MTFGQHVPSWDSEYYKLMMSQNIKYKLYLESKWMMLVVGTLLSFLLSIPYLYFGVKIFGMIAAGAMFNIGVNSILVLWGGALNRTPIKLNEKAKGFGNTQAFSASSLLISFPKIILPMILFYIPYRIFDSWNAGLVAIGLTGLLCFLFKGYFLNRIERIYQKGKYKTVAAYADKK